MLGKVYYASPEQYKGFAVNVDFSSDLYSIGIILYEIITGKNLLYKYIVLENDRRWIFWIYRTRNAKRNFII